MADKPFSTINANTNKTISLYTQGQQLAARVVLILWLLSSNLEDALAVSNLPRTPAKTKKVLWAATAAVLLYISLGSTLRYIYSDAGAGTNTVSLTSPEIDPDTGPDTAGCTYPTCT